MSRIFILMFSFFGFSNCIRSQIIDDYTEDLGVAIFNGSMLYGAGASFFDVNEDGWDDLTVCISGAPTRFYLNQQGQFQLVNSFDNIYDSKTCLWADYDEDGDNDLFVIRRNGPHQLFKQTDSLVFVDCSMCLNTTFSSLENSFGGAFGDLNKDSYLDLFIANYGTSSAVGIKNKLFTNTTDGNFSVEFFGYQRNSFQPTWIDLGNDGFQDLFIINDFRKGSELFTKSVFGEFVDQTSNTSYGLMPPIDAMSNSWCDFDNDGDFDVYITNTPLQGNYLLSNNGENIFTNIAADVYADLHKWSWSALWLDLENDGWNDLLVNSRHLGIGLESLFGNHMLRNNQGVFSLDTVHGADDISYGFFTSAKGDINNDGLYDVYFGAESAQVSKVYLNTTSTSNNYIKLRLKGRLSNRNGVGTRIDYYVNGSHRIHYTQSGENYLCQNSQNFIFGLGDNNQIDSLQLKWQSGLVDKYYNLSSNNFYTLTEGENYPTIQASKAYLCPTGNDSLQLSISDWPLHTWSNGSSGNSIWVYAPGDYSVTVGTGYGHTIQLSYSVEIANSDMFEVSTTNVFCYGDSTGSIEVRNINSDEVVFALENLPLGLASFPLTIAEGCAIEQNIFIDEPLPFLLVVDSTQSSCNGLNTGSAIIQGQGGTAPYLGFNEYGILQLSNLLAGDYTDTITDANGCAATYSFSITEIPAAIVEVTSPNWVCAGESVAFEANVSGIGSNYIWDVLAPGALLGAGTYFTAVVDSSLCVTTVDVNIEEIPAPSIDAVMGSESALGLGSITLNIIGEHGPYVATWESGYQGLSHTDLSQGTYIVSVADSHGCTTDTTFVVMFNFIDEGAVNTEFIVDWKEGVLWYKGESLLVDIEIYNSIGQLIFMKSTLGQNESIDLDLAPQTLFISSSKGNSRTKVVLR